MLYKVLALALLASASAQGVGKGREEVHLKMPINYCTKADGCVYQDTSAVLDSNWRWTHVAGCTNSSQCNCYLGNVWQNTTCPDPKTCTDHCVLDGEDEKGYKLKYGVEVDGKGLMNLTFVSKYNTAGANGTNVGNRMYLLEDDDHYKQFNLLNKEFTFTVDMSDMPCGLNGAVYFVEMDPDGGVANNPTNTAGARYGTGYCDAQCPHDMKWINGQANMIGWNGSKSDPNVGFGKYGTCCAELDIWEANKISTQMTVHSCTTQGPHRCDGIECGDNAKGQRFDGVCDKNGCDFNPYRVGAHDFYGPGPQFKLDSTKPMTVVTQFITTDGTDTGDLKEMRRFYVQDNKTVENPQPIYSANPDDKAISDQFCAVQMTNFSDRLDVFKAKGGIAGMGKAIGRGMSLVISLWDDHEVGMIWLDATDPFTPDPSGPGGYPWGALRGTCNQTSGNYSIVEKLHGDSYGLFSDFRYGEIGTTLGPAGPAPPAPPPACPGGSLATCIAQCPTSPPAAYQKCLNDCIANCGHMEEALEQTVVYPGEGYGVPTKA